ncbi:MAG: ribosome maturation factor [Acidobacteria bacterium]|jgi:ribosome maturation factor RimP|nr:ribosome maturation factor [Acidobacteriota bacterium]
MVERPVDDRRQRLHAMAERVAGGHGLEVFDLQWRRESIGWVLRVMLDRPDAGAGAEDGIGVDECQNVSRELSAVLDVEEVVDGAYTLEVSSPGLDRPLRRPADYRRFAGRLAQVVVSEAVDGQSFLKGRIHDVTDEAVLLEAGSRVHCVPFGVITRARLEVEF